MKKMPSQNQPDYSEIVNTIAIMSAEMGNVNKLIYNQPITQKMKQKLIQGKAKIFHPKEWSIDNFQVGRHLSKGKYGHVYLVREKETKLILALKRLTKSKVMGENIMNQVRRQLEIHSHLDHPNILAMYGFFYNRKDLFIMMEYSPKGDLYGLLRKVKRFDESRVKRYMRQMISAVHYLQSMNIIHRDIKPENILVSINDELKLSDFGWSVKSSSSSRTTFCGTPEYFCPQIIKFKPFDYKVDNWSLGILAYELFCGHTPFCENDRKIMYKKIVWEDIVYPEYVSKEFIDFVENLTRKQPEDRLELGDALNHPWLKLEEKVLY